MTATIAQGCRGSASKSFIVAALAWIYSRRGWVSHTLPNKDDAHFIGWPPCHNRSKVVIIRWPTISNLDEFAQLGQIADIQRAEYPNQLEPAKIIVLPWSMHVSSDLAWFHSQDLEEPLSRIARTGTPIIGICGGSQVRGDSIIDSHRVDGSARGLGLSPPTTVFRLDKLVGNTRARFFDVPGTWQTLSEGEFDGYDIRHDRTEPTTTDPNRMTTVLSNHDGFVADNLLGVATHWCLRVHSFGRPVQCRSHGNLRNGYPPYRRHHGATPKCGFNRSIGVYLTTGPRRESVVLVNADDGKGKTSAAMDVAMRSSARGWRVAVDSPVNVDLVLTGSDVPKEVIEIADTVTDIQDVKHAFE